MQTYRIIKVEKTPKRKGKVGVYVNSISFSIIITRYHDDVGEEKVNNFSLILSRYVSRGIFIELNRYVPVF